MSCLKHNSRGAQTQSPCRAPAPGLHQARVALRAGPMKGHRRAAKAQGGRAPARINPQTGRGCLSAAPRAQPGARSEFPGPTLGRSSAGQRRRQAGPMPQGLARRAARVWCCSSSIKSEAAVRGKPPRKRSIQETQCLRQPGAYRRPPKTLAPVSETHEPVQLLRPAPSSRW